MKSEATVSDSRFEVSQKGSKLQVIELIADVFSLPGIRRGFGGIF